MQPPDSPSAGTILTETDALVLRVRALEVSNKELTLLVRELHRGNTLLLAALLHALVQKKVDHASLLKMVPLVQTHGLTALGFAVSNPDESPPEDDVRPDALERYKVEGIAVWDGKTSTGR